MKNHSFEACRLTGGGLLAPASVLVAAGTILGFGLRQPTPLAASVADLSDVDSDGIVYHQERILETFDSEPDSDLDGFRDAEEIARKSSPLATTDIPGANELSVGITARWERGELHALIAAYLPDHEYRSVDIDIGILVGRRLVTLRRSFVVAEGSVEFEPALDPNALIALIDLPFSPTWVEATGHLTMFATVTRRGDGTPAAADVMDLFDHGGVIVLAIPDTFFNPAPGGSVPMQMGSGNIYKPLTPDDYEPPAGWELGQICFQTSEIVSYTPPIIVHHVATADCQDGWDGACPPDCSSSVGTTYATVDPVQLVGG